MGAWFLGGFCTSLRVEEMLLIDLAGAANSLSNMNDAKDAHFLFVILGRKKTIKCQEQNLGCLARQ
jgi:hypothetical protein